MYFSDEGIQETTIWKNYVVENIDFQKVKKWNIVA